MCGRVSSVIEIVQKSMFGCDLGFGDACAVNAVFVKVNELDYVSYWCKTLRLKISSGEAIVNLL